MAGGEAFQPSLTPPHQMGAYRVSALIARGRRADVWWAEANSGPVALRTPHKNYSRAQFDSEQRRSYVAGGQRGALRAEGAVEPLIRGDHLGHLLQAIPSHGPVNIHELISLAHGVLYALAEHPRGHGQLRPSHILIDESGAARLIDADPQRLLNRTSSDLEVLARILIQIGYGDSNSTSPTLPRWLRKLPHQSKASHALTLLEQDVGGIDSASLAKTRSNLLKRLCPERRKAWAEIVKRSIKLKSQSMVKGAELAAPASLQTIPHSREIKSSSSSPSISLTSLLNLHEQSKQDAEANIIKSNPIGPHDDVESHQAPMNRPESSNKLKTKPEQLRGLDLSRPKLAIPPIDRAQTIPIGPALQPDIPRNETPDPTSPALASKPTTAPKTRVPTTTPDLMVSPSPTPVPQAFNTTLLDLETVDAEVSSPEAPSEDSPAEPNQNGSEPPPKASLERAPTARIVAHHPLDRSETIPQIDFKTGKRTPPEGAITAQLISNTSDDKKTKEHPKKAPQDKWAAVSQMIVSTEFKHLATSENQKPDSASIIANSPFKEAPSVSKSSDSLPSIPPPLKKPKKDPAQSSEMEAKSLPPPLPSKKTKERIVFPELKPTKEALIPTEVIRSREMLAIETKAKASPISVQKTLQDVLANPSEVLMLVKDKGLEALEHREQAVLVVGSIATVLGLVGAFLWIIGCL